MVFSVVTFLDISKFYLKMELKLLLDLGDLLGEADFLFGEAAILIF